MWHSPETAPGEPRRWISREWFDSSRFPGVRFEIARISFLGRIELLKKIRGLIAEMECRAAGSSDRDRADAGWLSLQIQKAYVECGLTQIEGLLIDDELATPGLLLKNGPEDLCEEIATKVRERTFLREDERKN